MKLARILLWLMVAVFSSAPAFAAGSDVHMVMVGGKGVTASFSDEVAELGGTITYTHDIGIAFVAGLTDDAAAQLGANENVQEIVRSESFELETSFDGNSLDSVAADLSSSDDPTTASRYSFQWNMRAISADEAWAAGRTGSADITIAILDTGIDYTYPDLAGRVDLSRSVSFIPLDDSLVEGIFPGRHPITDLHYHGTHVASTASSNSNVIAGVTTKTTLMGVKVCSVAGSCPFDAVIAGVLHAADAGADIANMSLGGSFTKAGNGRFVGFINKVFNYARSQGMLVVVSAGNASSDLDHDGNSYKSYCSTPSTVCVSATGPTSSDNRFIGPWYEIDALASYSNFGRSAINVAAPGGNTGASVWAACSQTSLVIPVCGTGTFILGLGGTSMAAPHVSGVAALIAEDVGRNPGKIRAQLQQSADDLGESGTDPAYGKGRINAGNAVSQ